MPKPREDNRDIFETVLGNPPDEDMAPRTLFDRAIEEAGVAGGTILGALMFRRFGRKKMNKLVRDARKSRIARDAERTKDLNDSIEAASRLRNVRTLGGAVLGAASGGMAGEAVSNRMRRWRKK